MADYYSSDAVTGVISQIQLPNDTLYDIKDAPARQGVGAALLFGREDLPALATKTYTDVVATTNDNTGGGFFYLRVRPTAYAAMWHVKVRVIATTPSSASYYTDSIFDIWGHENTYSAYSSANIIYSTSYRPIYYHSLFFTNSTGYTNNCSHWIGVNLYNATNNTTVNRTIKVEVLAYDGCEIELQDNLITSTNIPNRSAHTGWYTSTYDSYTNFNASDNGLKQTGDANSTSISNLYGANGNYVADSALYRYQLLFQKDENTLTPLNNVSNTTGTSKTMLTNVEFNPFGKIFYYATTTSVSAGAAIGGGSLFFNYSGFDLRYTLNCGKTLTAHKPIYLVVTPTSNGKCKIASTTPWAQTLPATNDGKWYILIGRTYSTYQAALYYQHPIYYHDGTTLRELLPQSSLANPTFAGLMSSADKIKLDHISITKTTIDDEDVFDIEFV